MPERLCLVLQDQGKANLSAVSKILCLCFVECQTRLMVSSGLKTCDFALCLNLATFISKPDLSSERCLLVQELACLRKGILSLGGFSSQGRGGVLDVDHTSGYISCKHLFSGRSISYLLPNLLFSCLVAT